MDHKLRYPNFKEILSAFLLTVVNDLTVLFSNT
jgi:hypothetical protein